MIITLLVVVAIVVGVVGARSYSKRSYIRSADPVRFVNDNAGVKWRVEAAPISGEDIPARRHGLIFVNTVTNESHEVPSPVPLAEVEDSILRECAERLSD